MLRILSLAAVASVAVADATTHAARVATSRERTLASEQARVMQTVPSPSAAASPIPLTFNSPTTGSITCSSGQGPLDAFVYYVVSVPSQSPAPSQAPAFRVLLVSECGV